MNGELILYVIAVKKNSNGNITDLMFFLKDDNMNPNKFYIQSAESVIYKINENIIFKSCYFQNGLLIEGSQIKIVNGFLKTEANTNDKDNLPIIKDYHE